MFKHIRGILSLSLVFYFSLNFAEGRDIGKIAAVVNDHIISDSDLDARLKLAFISSGLEDTSETRQKFQSQILKTMIDEILQRTTAAKFDIKVSEPEVHRAFSEFERRNDMQPGQLKDMLLSQNIPLESMYDQIRAMLVWREYIQARYQGVVQINEQDIDRAEKQLAVKKDKPQLLLAEIFLSVDGSETEEKVRQKAFEFVAKIRQGTPFMALAQQFSQNASAARGGDIGWVSEDQVDSDLASALKGLQPGQLTDPVKTQNGYYILIVRERRAPGESLGKDTLLSFNQILFPVSQPFTDEKLEPVFNKAKSIAASAKSCGLLKTLVTGDSNIQMREMQKTSMKDMPPQLTKLLLKLDIGQASEPILSDLGFIVFMTCAKEDINPDNPTRKDIQGLLFEKKLEQLSQREMRTIRQSAHIDIRVPGEKN